MGDGWGSEQCVKVIHTKVGLSQDCAQRAAIEFLMVRNHELREGIVAPQDDMGAVLAFLVETDFGKRPDAVAA
jgi:hypothetical protein